MLSGTTAFPGDSLPSVIYQVVFQLHPSLVQLVPTISPKVAAAVDRALAKSPADRFPDMAAFVEALTGRPLMTVNGQSAPVAAGAPIGLALEPTMVPVSASAVALAATAAASDIAVAPAALGTSLAPAGPGPAGASVAAKGKHGLWLSLAAVAVIAAVAAAVALRPQRPADARASQAGAVLAAPGVASEPVVVPTVDARQVVAALAAPVAPVAPTLAEEKHPERAARGRSAAHEEQVPPAVAAELDVAESALAAKDLGEAIRRARHSLYEKKTSRASAILTRAYCLQGDLGAAKAELGHVAAPERTRVVKSCHAAGIEL
jgi:serine/threonine-protein kinase